MDEMDDRLARLKAAFAEYTAAEIALYDKWYANIINVRTTDNIRRNRSRVKYLKAAEELYGLVITNGMEKSELPAAMDNLTQRLDADNQANDAKLMEEQDALMAAYEEGVNSNLATIDGFLAKMLAEI